MNYICSQEKNSVLLVDQLLKLHRDVHIDITSLVFSLGKAIVDSVTTLNVSIYISIHVCVLENVNQGQVKGNTTHRLSIMWKSCKND